MTKAGQDYHCALTIDGTKYLMTGVDVKGWSQEKDVNPFAPRITIGEQTYSDLSVWSVLSQEDWRHGFGHRRFEDEAGYHKSSGSIDTRHKDVVQLATRIVESDADLTAQVNQFLDAGGYLWAATGAGLRMFDPGDSSWEDCGNALVDTEEIYALLTNGKYLFVARNGAQILKIDLGNLATPPEDTVPTTTGVDANAADYRYLALGGGRLWASKDGDNHVHWASSIDASDWDGDENDTNRITVGPGDPDGAVVSVAITGMAWFDGFLYVSREDGLWRIYPDDNVAYQVLDWKNESRTTNGKGMLVWQDKLIIPKGPQLFAFTGTTISDITPPTTGQSFPYTGYGNFEALATFGPYLYVTAQEGALNVSSETLRPNAEGSTTELLHTSGSANWEMVDEASPDYFITTNYCPWPNPPSDRTDLYDIAATGLSSETINKITVHAVVYGSTIAPDVYSVSLAVKPSGGSTDFGTEQDFPTHQWSTLSEEWTLNPHDSAAWAPSDLADLEIGLKFHYDGDEDYIYVTQVYVEVEYQATLMYPLLCFDGSAWHSLGSLDAGGKCLYLSAETDDLWINDYDNDNTNWNTRYMQVQEHSFLPKDDYPTSGTHSLELSRIDCKLRLVAKCFHELYVEADNLTAARYLTAYYRISGETWVSLGNVTQSPIQTVDLSDITGKYIDFRLDFVTDSATESPVLEALALRYVARPTTVYGHTLSFEIGPKIKALAGDIIQDHSTKEWHDALKSARDSTVPITYETPYGEDVSVFVSAIAFPEHVFEAKGEETGTATISIVEVD